MKPFLYQALVANAASLGVHWIYNHKKLKEIAQKQSLLSKIQKLVGEDLKNKNITIWGLAFKPHTDDIREAPSLVVIKQLLDRGANITVVDPIAFESAEKISFLTSRSSFAASIIKSMPSKSE